MRPVPLLAALCVVASLAVAPPAHGADAISTDRPDVVESSDVVGPGRFQIETSVQSQRDSSEGVKTRLRTTPTLLRFGVGESLELRVESDGRSWSKTEDASGTRREKGWSDTSFGVKWRQQEGDEATGRPGLAWLFDVEADTGSSAFRGQGWRPTFRGVAEWDLPHDFSIGVMPGVVLDRNDEGKRFVGGILAVSVGKKLSERWRTYLELAGQQLASSRNGGSTVTLDTGLAWTVTDWCQLDLSVQRGLTHDSPDWTWALGASVRF